MNKLIKAQLQTPKSTVIKKMNFDNIRKDLSVHFRNGSVYIYTPVSEEFYNKLKDSESKGKFFNKNIKDNEALTCLKLIK